MNLFYYSLFLKNSSLTILTKKYFIVLAFLNQKKQKRPSHCETAFSVSFDRGM